MKRWIVKAGTTSLEGLTEQEAARPEPGRGEVRIKVHAVSLNARDQLLISGAYGVPNGDFIAIADGAGEIDALGSGVDGWSIGDRVTGLYFRDWHDGPPAQDQGWGLGSDGQDGMLAEYVILKADRIAAMPKSLSFEEAACLPCAALTAWTALNGDRPYRRPIGAADKVLVTGTGAVSLFALLFAKARGAAVVATTSQEEKGRQVLELGALDTVNYKQIPNWGEIAAERTGGFDRVVNAAGSAAIDQSIAAIAPGGDIALMGLYDHAATPPNFVGLMMKGGSIRGTAVGSAMAFADMAAFIDEHGIKPPIARIFEMAETKAAYQFAASGEPFGKVVIRVAG
ncbi:NAD(P)-dependent alcohol dehydrogenase (plasmid) [Sphingobium sp. SJ10-10]|uniref:zinc-dependent alcohol dehydrogenase family protein n=1 Tax=Sphingobium sp. SJ10-10 TaxID=3114999 RepID=UPI002E18FBC6|nr:NAD(P)-dependent alcohol dehydrogenase [Sphingobium sp. SJ10-10]